MLDDIAPLILGEKRRDLVGRLNNKRVDQALPAEMELLAIWSLRTFPILELEPFWCAGGKKPEAFVEKFHEERDALIEVIAVSDNDLSGERDMDTCSQIFVNYANRKRKGAGDKLYFEFGESSRQDDDGRNVRYRQAPPKYEPSMGTLEAFENWLSSAHPDGPGFEVQEHGLSVRIVSKEIKLPRYHNFHSSMPAECYSLSDNFLFRRLKEKATQLSSDYSDSLKLLFVFDAGSRFISRRERTTGGNWSAIHRSGPFSAREVIEHYFSRYPRKVDAVIIFSPQVSRHWRTGKKQEWSYLIVSQNNCPDISNTIGRLCKDFPIPRFDGFNARSLHRQGAMEPISRGWYMGTEVNSNEEKTVLRFSSRVLLDVLSGRAPPRLLNEALTLGHSGTVVASLLDHGYSVASICIDSGAPDMDDDWIVLEFQKDAALKPFE